MDKTKQSWYVLEQPKRLVLIYRFNYDEDKEYNAQWLAFLKTNGITADKIIKQMPAGDGSEEIHVLGEDAIQQYALVRFTAPKEHADKYDFKIGQQFVYLGEIPNMPGHCVVADVETGRIHSGYHVENFEVVNDV
jgi:hypothetical protein